MEIQGESCAEVRPRRALRPKWHQPAGILLVLVATVYLEAQSAAVEPTINTDRPSVANSSVVVPKGTFQAENGWLVTKSSGDYVFDFPETELRFGLLNRTELRLFVPDYYHTLTSPDATVSGFGDTAIGVKQQIGPIQSFNFAAILLLGLPTGANAISSHGYDPAVQLPWSRHFAQNWIVAGQAAFYWPTVAGRHDFTDEDTIYFDRQLTKAWDAFLEYAGDFPERGGTRQILHFGSAYKLSPRQQIDFQAAAGLSKSAPNLFVGFGYSFYFQVSKCGRSGVRC